MLEILFNGYKDAIAEPFCPIIRLSSPQVSTSYPWETPLLGYIVDEEMQLEKRTSKRK